MEKETQKDVLIVESNPGYLVAAIDADLNSEIVDNLEEAMEKLKNDPPYSAVISGLYLNDPENPEGVIIGKRCLEKNIPFTILAGEDKKMIRKTRSRFYDDKELVDLVEKEDPVKELIFPLIGFDKTDPNLWELAYNHTKNLQELTQ